MNTVHKTDFNRLKLKYSGKKYFGVRCQNATVESDLATSCYCSPAEDYFVKSCNNVTVENDLVTVC